MSRPGKAVIATDHHLAELIQAPITDLESLRQAARDHALGEELALAMLDRRDLPGAVIEEVAKNSRAMKSRKVQLAVVLHQRTPRHISIPRLRHLFTFELMQVALNPHIATDVKLAAEQGLISRLESISSGERLTLAKQASAAIAAAMLLDSEHRIVEAALQNPRLTEGYVVKSLLLQDASQHLTLQVCHHPKWSLRKDVRAALLRSKSTPLAFAITSSNSFTPAELKEIFSQSQLDEKIKGYLLEIAQKRKRVIR